MTQARAVTWQAHWQAGGGARVRRGWFIVLVHIHDSKATVGLSILKCNLDAEADRRRLTWLQDKTGADPMHTGNKSHTIFCALFISEKAICTHRALWCSTVHTVHSSAPYQTVLYSASKYTQVHKKQRVVKQFQKFYNSFGVHYNAL